MNLIKAAQLVGYQRKRDKSVSLRFETQELSSHEIMEIDTLLECFGYLMFKPENKLTEQEIKELDSLETDLYDNPKTQSQRLRNVLFKWHMKQVVDNVISCDFKEYYKLETERIIQHYKNKL